MPGAWGRLHEAGPRPGGAKPESLARIARVRRISLFGANDQETNWPIGLIRPMLRSHVIPLCEGRGALRPQDESPLKHAKFSGSALGLLTPSNSAILKYQPRARVAHNRSEALRTRSD